MTQALSTHGDDATLPILQDIHRSFGMLPNLFRAYAKHPALLAANWNKVKGVLLDGVISRQAKEIMAFLVSMDNSCAYCVAAHTAALRSLGMDQRQIDAMLLGFYPPDLKYSDVELIKFARKVNQHWREISEGDVESLKKMGIGEAAIIETIGIVELFAGFNRFARVMKVEVDFPDAA